MLRVRALGSDLLVLACTLALACGESSGEDSGTDTLLSTSGVEASGGTQGTSDPSTGNEGDTSDGETLTTDGSSTNDSTASTSDATSDSSDSSESGDTGDEPVPLCQIPCASVADCVQPSATGAYDEDNYECAPEGYCVYTGCNSDSECAALGNYLCSDALGDSYCTAACDVPADCDLGAGAAYDADNYNCEGGACVYAGCNSDAECEVTTAGTLCVDLGAGYGSCVPACNSAADCSQGQLAYDADNYECVAGHCEYIGCNSDAECMEFTSLICI